MADYAFYTDIYLGSLIPPKAFYTMAQRANERLNRLQQVYQVHIPGEESRKMAICAMAETLYAHGKRRGGVISAGVGEVNVRYENGSSADRMLNRELFEQAAIYLDICRGVQE
jgi:hypothetical protein